ncbi:MAG: hypothetical protein WC759_01385 [Candidatus Micrarchaeia archaeon]|jgi:hypothetical protein
MFSRGALFAILVAFVLLAGCPGQQVPPAQVPAPQPIPPIDTGPDIPVLQPGCLVKVGADRDACFKQEAFDTGDTSKCYLIMDSLAKEECIYVFALTHPELCIDLTGPLADDCYYNAANMTVSEAECAKIADAVKRSACEGMFSGPCDAVSPVGYNRSFCEASATHDVSKCQDGSEFADACTFDYAMKFKARGACDKISYDAVKYACLGTLSDDVSYCSSVNVTEKTDLCKTIMAGELGDAGVCAGITLGSTGQYKYSVQGTVSYIVQCYANVGIKLRNSTVCEQMQSGIDRDGCYDAVARGTLDPAPCSKIYTSVSLDGTPLITTKHDGCYRDVAKALGDPRVCNPIIEKISRDRYCYLQIIYGRTAENGPAYNFTLEMCKGIVDTNRKWTCVSEYAKRVQDPALCLLITDDAQFGATRNACLDASRGSMKRMDYLECKAYQSTEQQDSCYRDVAKNTGNPAICNYISDDITRNTYCYMDLIQGQNVTLAQCQAISDYNVKWLCVSDLAQRTNDNALCQTIPKNVTVTVANDVYTSTTAIKDDCVRSTGG